MPTVSERAGRPPGSEPDRRGGAGPRRASWWEPGALSPERHGADPGFWRRVDASM